MNEEGCTFVSPKIWDNTQHFSTACQTPVFALFDDILLCKHIGSGIKGGANIWHRNYYYYYLFIFRAVGSGWDWYVWRLVTQKMEEGVGTGSLKNNPNYFLISNVLLTIFKILFGTQTPPNLSTNFLTNQLPIPSP